MSKLVRVECAHQREELHRLVEHGGTGEQPDAPCWQRAGHGRVGVGVGMAGTRGALVGAAEERLGARGIGGLEVVRLRKW